jgi:hypothetical protein
VPALVWTVFAVLLVVSIRLTVAYSLPAPYWDEWGLVPEATGSRPVTLEWLWAPHNEHRIPIPKIYYVWMARITALDARPFNVIHTLLLGSLACLGIITARRIRGRTDLADSFLVLVFLPWNHWYNVTHPFQISFVLSTFLFCIVLFLILGHEESRCGRTLVIGGIAILGIPLCGTHGVPLALTLAPWLFWVGLGAWRRPDRGHRPHGGIGMACALLTGAILAACLIDLPVSPDHPVPGLGALLEEATKCLSVALGRVAVPLWPFSGIAMLVLLASTILLAAAAWRRDPGERARAAGLLLAILSICATALVVGYGRAGVAPDMGFSPRYGILTCPALLAAYLGLEAFGRPILARIGQVFLALVMWGLLWPNTDYGIRFAETNLARGKALAADVRGGRPIEDLARIHWRRSFPIERDLATYLQMLADARMSIYRDPIPTGRDVEPPPLLSAVMTHPGSADSGDVIPLPGGGWALYAHSPTELSLPLPEDVVEIRFAFGIRKEAYAGGGGTDGVEFLLARQGPHGERRILWSRLLEPVREESDRGTQGAAVRIHPPPAGPATLIFQTAPGPRGDGAWDWAYWSDVMFVRP